MPRPYCRRRVGWMPCRSRFLPEGVDPRTAGVVGLTLDELEAIRLADLLGMYQEEAAQKMGVSRPTFARVLESGRKKVAEALVNGKGLLIEGGPVEMEATAFGPGRIGHPCHRGGEPLTERFDGRRRHGQGMGPAGFCVCPKCGFRKEHLPGVPCVEERCPSCGVALVREGSEHDRLIRERKKPGK